MVTRQPLAEADPGACRPWRERPIPARRWAISTAALRIARDGHAHQRPCAADGNRSPAGPPPEGDPCQSVGDPKT